MQTITREEMATALGLQLEDVAIRKAGGYSRHIAIKGTSYCGRLNNDGYNIPTEYDELSGGECGTCVKRYKAKAGN
jgi:hypothetical protein